MSSADPSLSLPHQSHTVPVATRPRVLLALLQTRWPAEGTVSFPSLRMANDTPLPRWPPSRHQFPLIYALISFHPSTPCHVHPCGRLAEIVETGQPRFSYRRSSFTFDPHVRIVGRFTKTERELRVSHTWSHASVYFTDRIDSFTRTRVY